MRKNLYRQRARSWEDGSKGEGPSQAVLHEDDEALLFSEGADLGMIMGAIRAHIPLILLIGIIGTLIGIGVALSQTSVYTAVAQVKLDPRSLQIADVNSVLTENPLNDTTVDTEAVALRSVGHLNSVIEELDLDEDPEFNPALREEEEGFLSGVTNMLKPASEDEEGELSEDEQLASVRQILNDKIGVARVGLTAVIAVGCDSESAEKSAAICNALVNRYVEAQREYKVDIAGTATSTLEERIDELRAELEEKERAVEEFRVRNQIIGLNGITKDQQLLGELNTQLAQTKLELAEKRARLAQARRLVKGRSGTQTLAEVLGSDTIRQLRDQESQIIRTRSEFASRYRETHPEMIRINRELRDIQTQIEDEVERITSNLANELEVSQARARSLEENISEVEERMQENANVGAKLRELEQDAQATRDVYVQFLTRFEGLKDTEKTQRSDSMVLSAASVPTQPSRPNRMLIVAIAVVLSGILGAGAAIVLDFTDERVRTPDSGKRATGLPHLGSVPIVTARQYKGRPHRDLLDRGTSVFSEAFEELYTRVQSLSGARPPRTVLFTSATAAEGKTTSALCFALAAARSGKRVVLLEGDLRCPTIYDVVAIQGVQVEDLKAVLDGDLEWEEIAWTEPQTGLRILPVKAPSDDPIAHLSSHRLEELLEDLRAEFDMVVIDTAPVIPVSDALKLMPYADKVIFVMRWREATKSEVEAAVRKIRDVGGDIAGFMLTFVNQQQRWRFGSGGLPNVRGRNRRYYGRG